MTNSYLKQIELRWQKVWEEKKLFSPGGQGNKPKYFNFDSAPFPNGNLHLGHARNYVLGDIVARYKRLRGFDVLYCTNFDSFGLPNQLEAEKCRESPQEFTLKCISLMQRDLKRLGISYDWSRVHSTSDSEYYKWTQWLFLEFYSAGLVYRKESDINWCNNCETVLAYMEAKDGRCERCDSVVVRKRMLQWFIALSKYSEELYSSIDSLKGWSKRAKNLLKGFIGKVSGTLVPFRILGNDKILEVFLPGGHCLEDVTFVGTVANLPGIEDICQPKQIDCASIFRELQINPAMPRKRNSSEYTNRIGVDSGIKLEHPSLGVPIPLLFVNYLSDKEGPPVKAGVPVSDKTDKLLANKLLLPESNNRQILRDIKNIQAKDTSYYHVHDWMVSRQKKWGTPLPFIECEWCGFVPARKEDLPVIIKSAKNSEDKKVVCPKCNRSAKYVEDTLDCYLDDIWCFLSSELTAKNNFSLEQTGKYDWFPVDQYHAGYDIYMYLHLYRFVAMFLFERGCLNTPEPVLVYHGHDMVLQNNRKMSKHHHNTINLNTLMDKHGADIVRIAIMFAANPNRPIRWDDGYLLRARKLLLRVLEMGSILSQAIPASFENTEYRLPILTRKALENKSKKLIAVMAKYIESYRTGSCIQCLEQHTGELYYAIKPLEDKNINDEDYQFMRSCLLTFCVLLSPFAPHMAEETWKTIGGEKLVSQANWPE